MMTGWSTALQRSPLFLISLCLPWLVLLGWLAAVAWFLCDDAFISFRYVRNLLEGHGLVFNPGEYVEGYTNFLWVLELAAIWRLSGIPPEQAAPWLSVVCTVGTIAAMLWWVMRLPGVRQLAHRGYALQLAARDPVRLEREVQDLRVRTGAAVTSYCWDALRDGGGASFLDTLDPLPDVAVCVVGLLGDQAESQRDGGAAERVMRTNYVGPALLMGALAERFEQRGSGVLVGVSSVAGERGRASNYVYGSAKAGLTAFLSGLRNRLAHSGVHVVAVKPGFVRTRMTDGMDLPAWLTATPQEVAAAVVQAIRRRRDVVYVRRVWRPIMFLLRAIPESVFKRMRL